MIFISIKNNKETIEEIIVEGHALFNHHGKDIVCAGVSAITFGIMNSLNLNKVKINKNNNKILFNVIDDEDYETQIILKTFEKSLFTIYNKYKDYIEIRRK